MDADRFDSISRLLSSSSTRRAALPALLASAIGLTSYVHPNKVWAGGRCKPACRTCQSCKKGKCVRTANGKRCKRGKCVSVRNGQRCSGGTCLGGRCAPFPTLPPPCRRLRQSCDDDCCDGLVCGDNGCEKGRVCLRPLGAECSGDDCNCSQVLQKCSPVTGTCRACVFPEETCQVADDCCICGNDCECGTSAGDKKNVCCFTQGSINCQVTSECCAGLVCEIGEDGFGECVTQPR
jgi:hypothetical protein